MPKQDTFTVYKPAEKAGLWKICHIVRGESAVDKECLTFVAAIDKNWRSPVAKAA
jgi:hypothetical protein